MLYCGYVHIYTPNKIIYYNNLNDKIQSYQTAVHWCGSDDGLLIRIVGGGDLSVYETCRHKSHFSISTEMLIESSTPSYKKDHI